MAWLAFGATCSCLLGLSSCQSAGIQRAYMALDGTGNRRRTLFFTDTQGIWCDVEYSTGRKDTTIDAQIRAIAPNSASPELPATDTLLASGEIVGQTGVDETGGFEWTVTQADGGTPAPGGLPYPVGNFACEVRLEGQLVATLPFTVKYPTCPVPPVVPGASCAGWVAPGSSCVDAFARSCTCENGAWAC